MGRVRALAEQAIEAVLSEFDLTLANFDVLASLRRAGKPYQRTPTELASSTLLTSGGMTFRLDRVEDAGLVERVPSSEDRRVTYARLTSEGLRVVEAAMTAHIANEERLLSGLTAEERRTLSQLLRKLELSIQRTSQDGEHPS
jgi:DNA-binding MarR family transcriptional regulator